MENIHQKYNSLDIISQRMIDRLIEILANEKKDKSKQFDNYKKRILKVSVWNKKDLQIFDEIKKNFNNMKELEW